MRAPSRRARSPTAAIAGAGAAAAGAALATVYAQRRLTRRIAADPRRALLENPPVGREVGVRSADGTLLHAEVFGSEDAPTIVLAHGWTEALTYWVYQICELSQDFRVVAYDLRGHHRSGRSPGDDYSLARFGDDVGAVLGACVPDSERAVLAGHSLGAMSIAAWAEHHDVEERIRAAALLNTGLSDLITEQLIVRAPQLLRSLSDPISRRVFLGSRASLPRISSPIQHAALSYFAFGPAATPAQVAFYERMLVASSPDVRGTVGIAIADMDLSHALEGLTVPTLVLAGELDKLTPPSHARRIAAALPQLSALVVLPETGHMGPLERPEQVSTALRDLALATVGDLRRNSHPVGA